MTQCFGEINSFSLDSYYKGKIAECDTFEKFYFIKYALHWLITTYFAIVSLIVTKGRRIAQVDSDLERRPRRDFEGLQISPFPYSVNDAIIPT